MMRCGRNETMSSKECGICHSTEDLVGPYCGGPFMWYCKSCKAVIDAFLIEQERHHRLLYGLRKEKRCKQQ